MQAWEERYFEKQEAHAEGHAQGLEEGLHKKLIQQVVKKIQKDCTVEEIADLYEEPIEIVRETYDIAVQFAPEYDVDKIYEELQKTEKAE